MGKVRQRVPGPGLRDAAPVASFPAPHPEPRDSASAASRSPRPPLTLARRRRRWLVKPRMISESRQSAPISSRLGALRDAPRGDSGGPGSAMKERGAGSGSDLLLPPPPPPPPSPRAPWPRARRRRARHGAGPPARPPILRGPRPPAAPVLAPRRAPPCSGPARPRRQRPLRPGGEPDTPTCHTGAGRQGGGSRLLPKLELTA